MRSRDRSMTEVWLGVFTAFLLNSIAVAFLTTLLTLVTRGQASDQQYWAISLSVWLYQGVYLVPLIRWCQRTRRFGWMKGLIMGATFTALLIGGCFFLWLAQPD